MAIAIVLSRELESSLESLSYELGSSSEELVAQAIFKFIAEVKDKFQSAPKEAPLKVVRFDNSGPFRRHMRIP